MAPGTATLSARSHPPIGGLAMPQRVYKFRQRALIARLLVSALTMVADHYRNGKDFDDILIGVAILQGQTEGRRMTPAKLAQYLGIPRTTTLRRVAALVSRGEVVQDSDNRLSIPTTILNSDASLKVSDRLRQMIHDTCEALSKLDT